MKKVYIRTLGCEKNTVDSENAARLLTDAGCVIVNEPEKADVLLVNTCGFIGDAKKQSVEAIFELNEVKESSGGNKLLIVSGCLTQRYTSELEKELPEADYILGVNDYDKLPAIVLGSDVGRVNAGSCGSTYKELGSRQILTVPWTRSIKIAEGCANNCSYCIIPKIRGRYRSRREEDILNEARQLAAEGCKELVVIAQDVTFYGRDLGISDALPKLLRKISGIDGIKWIRLMYCYEDEITDGLIEEIRTNDKICKYIDIPIQHCSDDILKAMDRKSTHETIVNTVTKLRKQIPDIAIRTTLITGFPGERAGQFDELMEFIESMRFERLGAFSYSREEGTKAAEMKGQVRSDVKARRLDRIMSLQQRISLENNTKLIGRELEVLVEEVEDDGTCIGRTYMDAPDIDNSVIFTGKPGTAPGSFAKVKITDAFDYDLSGEEI
ncbi:MAG: 30S ribosomal protein S12 methylthiotransferase RimO [Clostridia bacterium]|nr:30S ribosomal protein S12 methylthiotransferase RimO [Clostridia bacterium]